MNVTIYARYSSDLQNERSIDDQVALCKQHLKQEEYVTAVYSDSAMSGSVMKTRPQLQKLLEHLTEGTVDIILAESLDRLSRDIEDIAHIYKLCHFHQVKIRTVLEGNIQEINIGFNGVMSSLFLKQLRERIRRGGAGNVRVGKSSGSMAYGYRVRQLNDVGVHEPGLREIHPEEAEVVRWIYQNYVDGISISDIVKELNKSAIPAKFGRQWNISTIRGHYERKSGILLNPIYAGYLVYNRVQYVRHPLTGKRHPRPQPENEWVWSKVPELQIVDEAIWNMAQARRSKTAHRLTNSASIQKTTRFRFQLTCAECGKSILSAGTDRYRCSGYLQLRICSMSKKLKHDAIYDALHREFSENLSDIVSNWSRTRDQYRARLSNEIKNLAGDALTSARQDVHLQLQKNLNALKASDIDQVTMQAKISHYWQANPLSFYNDALDGITLSAKEQTLKILHITLKPHFDISP